MRECLGCETYAKYTHTRPVVCAFYVRVRRPPPTLRLLLLLFESVERKHRAARSRLPSSIYTTCPLACSLYGPACLPCSLFLCLSFPGPSAAPVVPSGIRDDTSPISPRRECPRRSVRRRSHRHASLNPRAIYRACAPINGEPDCQIVIWTMP